MGRSKASDDDGKPKKKSGKDASSADIPRLTRYELEIMDVVWRLGEATVHDVCDNLARPLAYTTVMTTLSLLESKKGVLERAKVGRSFVYRPRYSRDDMSRSILMDLKRVLLGDSVPALVMNMMADESISADDVARLRKALEELEQEK